MTKSSKILLAVTPVATLYFAYPASANLTATKVDAVIFQYTAVDTNGVLTVTFTNQASFVTQLRFRLA